MTVRRNHSGFTLVELMIGMSLSLMVLTAVLGSYLFMGRNLVRLANQQTLETESRRALLYFAQDVRMASTLSSPSATGVTFTLPTSSSTTTVAYSYNSSAGTLTRTPATGTAQVLLHNLQSLTINYYNIAGNAITGTDTGVSIPNIRRIALSFTAQAGSSNNGTLTILHQVASPRLSMRNKAWSP
jgi:prepilin-type N-terminal cleavage/methylation domain-containing protein